MLNGESNPSPVLFGNVFTSHIVNAQLFSCFGFSADSSSFTSHIVNAQLSLPCPSDTQVATFTSHIVNAQLSCKLYYCVGIQYLHPT